MSNSTSWVIIWEGISFNSKGVQPGLYVNLQVANDDCYKLNLYPYSDKRYKVVDANSDEHLDAQSHVFSWKKP